jgi:alpha-galactosidase
VRKHIGPKNFFGDHTAQAQKRKKTQSWFSSDGLIACDFFRRFGVLGAAGDRHLAEFVPWYLTGEKDLHRWGAIATPSSFRIDYYRQPRTRPGPEDRLQGSGEEGTRQMMALLGMEGLDTNVNLPNQGQIPGLPMGAIVETNAQFREDSVKPVITRPLPPMVNSLVQRVIGVQRTVLRAGMEKNKELAFQAVLNDPLVNIPTNKAWSMFNEMLKATKALLPGWRI